MERSPELSSRIERIPQVLIEGRVETPISEIDPGDSQSQDLPAAIIWRKARLRFKEVSSYAMPMRFGDYEGIRLYKGVIDYEDPIKRKPTLKTVDLSSIVSSQKPCLFAGSRTGFYEHDPLVVGRNYPFFVIGIQPDELQKDMRRIKAIYHEEGHAYIGYHQLDLALVKTAITLQIKDLPQVACAVDYVKYVAQFMSDADKKFIQSNGLSPHTLNQLRGRNNMIQDAISLFHERNAWAAGARIFRRYGLPTGYDQPLSYIKYAKFCLSTYARYYNDPKFVKGWQ